MPKITFDYNLKKDAWSWVLIAKKKDCWGKNWRAQVTHIPRDLLRVILSSGFSKAQKRVEQYLKERPDAKYRALMIKQTLQGLAGVWKIVEKDFFDALSAMTKKPIYTKNFGCFLTTGFMCPYEDKEDWFMASLWHSIPHSVTTICHEIFHLQFLYHYKDCLIKSGLLNSQIEDLKEALSFLLNEPEFEKIIVAQDTGYPRHQKLRKKLKMIWDKEKDFEKFLDKAIKIVKGREICS